MYLNTIVFRVFPSPETNSHEVRILVDDKPFIAEHWPAMMGMDPEDFLTYRELMPRHQPHKTIVARCRCGCVGCGNVRVRISADGNRITWDAWRGDKSSPSAPTLTFEGDQYTQAVGDAVENHSWETPDRTAARILRSLVDHAVLERHNLKFEWASGRCRSTTLTISLGGPEGYHQILVQVPWNQQSPDKIAREAAEILKTDPGQWADVVWSGDKSEPPFTGPAWRK
jgi:hypothetical protein